jgi:hypothetical protein
LSQKGLAAAATGRIERKGLQALPPLRMWEPTLSFISKDFESRSAKKRPREENLKGDSHET